MLLFSLHFGLVINLSNLQAPLNIVLYNVFSPHGPNLYGVEDVEFYIKNLLLNWNVVVFLFPLAVPSAGLAYVWTRSSPQLAHPVARGFLSPLPFLRDTHTFVFNENLDHALHTHFRYVVCVLETLSPDLVHFSNGYALACNLFLATAQGGTVPFSSLPTSSCFGCGYSGCFTSVSLFD